MSWRCCVSLTACCHCHEPIHPGEVYRRGDYSPMAWCQTCAESRLLEQRPADVREPPVQRFALPVTFAKFKAPVDVPRYEREPGEEG